MHDLTPLESEPSIIGNVITAVVRGWMPEDRLLYILLKTCVSAAALAVWSQYWGAAEVRRPCTHSQVTPGGRCYSQKTFRPRNLRPPQAGQIHLKCVCLESQRNIRGELPVTQPGNCCCSSLEDKTSSAQVHGHMIQILMAMIWSKKMIVE